MANRKLRTEMNLQLFAEPPAETTEGAGEQAEEQPGSEQESEVGEQGDDAPEGGEQEPTVPSVQDLMEELAKLKRAQEKAAKEAAEYKRKYNEKLSEKERVDAEKAEKEAEREEQFQQLLRENKINKFEKYYLGKLDYTAEEASKMAVAEVDDDFDEKLKIQLAVDKRKKKEYEAEFYKNRPPVNAGAPGESVTLEQFAKMGATDRIKLKHSDPEGYERLRKAEKGGK